MNKDIKKLFEKAIKRAIELKDDDYLDYLLDNYERIESENALCYEAGKAEGRIEAKIEGKIEEKREIAKKLKSIGIPVDQIVTITELSLEEIEKL